MSFIQKHLLPGEQVLYISGKHWKIFLPAALLLTSGIVFLVLYLMHRELRLLIYAGIALAILATLL
ncbi:MAG TPA: hypothetical protein VMW38_10305, partial [Terriglobia bacterium]|nr:hypothetical protein [Terriglobia bacterium]